MSVQFGELRKINADVSDVVCVDATNLIEKAYELSAVRGKHEAILGVE